MVSTITLLSRTQKTVTALIGCLLLLVAGYLFARPPHRDTVETSEEGKIKRTSAHAEPSVVVITVLSAGTAFLLYSINGLKLTRLSAGGIDVETQDINDPKSSAGGEGGNEINDLLKKTNEQLTKFAEIFISCRRGTEKKFSMHAICPHKLESHSVCALCAIKISE